MLLAFLQQNRAILTWKLLGLDDEQARRAPFESDTSMIGLLQHLGVVEKYWFEGVFAGRDVDFGFDFDADGDAEWHLDGTETIAQATADYEAQVAISNAIVLEADLDTMSLQEPRGKARSLRWIVIHMIEETARHAGHADAVREYLDGTVGYVPDE